MNFLIGYRDDDFRIRYYRYFNGSTGRATCGTKKEAARFDSDTGGGNPQAATGARQQRLADGGRATAVQIRAASRAYAIGKGRG